ncbi:hypothetical protein [Paenibacillus apiarius]|nr:hypothetical protein [Paenibacillus apiarius]MCY9516878.1 hypothetical protein [Paenibacillus apiarius]MEC0120542.1 hypothetical protein [Paenibacillus apiarius]MEC0194073.1 hypothetical protein [Paenibacillus apiarius]
MEPAMSEEPKPSVWQWLNTLAPYLYGIGIAFILGWAFVSFVRLGFHSPQQDSKPSISASEPPRTGTASAGKSPSPQPAAAAGNETWLNIVVKPIVSSGINQIIFRTVFYLMVWMLLFLIIPVAFLRLKKFKLFQLEFEVDRKENAAVDLAVINATKANLMSYLCSDDAKAKTWGFLHNNAINYYEVLTYFLEEIQAGYLKVFNTGFSFQLYVQDLPHEMKELAEQSAEERQAVIRNKTDNDNLLRKNYLVYSYPYRQDRLVTVISSHSTQFDIFDRHLLQLLHSTIDTYVESIEFMVLVTTPASQPPQAH